MTSRPSTVTTASMRCALWFTTRSVYRSPRRPSTYVSPRFWKTRAGAPSTRTSTSYGPARSAIANEGNAASKTRAARARVMEPPVASSKRTDQRRDLLSSDYSGRIFCYTGRVLKRVLLQALLLAGIGVNVAFLLINLKPDRPHLKKRTHARILLRAS